jgi:hypothetical protein
MRQWLVDPKKMCRQHLLGEHCEHHMMLGSIRKKKNIDGFEELRHLENWYITAGDSDIDR